MLLSQTWWKPQSCLFTRLQIFLHLIKIFSINFCPQLAPNEAPLLCFIPSGYKNTPVCLTWLYARGSKRPKINPTGPSFFTPDRIEPPPPINFTQQWTLKECRRYCRPAPPPWSHGDLPRLSRVTPLRNNYIKSEIRSGSGGGERNGTACGNHSGVTWFTVTFQLRAGDPLSDLGLLDWQKLGSPLGWGIELAKGQPSGLGSTGDYSDTHTDTALMGRCFNDYSGQFAACNRATSTKVLQWQFKGILLWDTAYCLFCSSWMKNSSIFIIYYSCVRVKLKLFIDLLFFQQSDFKFMDYLLMVI